MLKRYIILLKVISGSASKLFNKIDNFPSDFLVSKIYNFFFTFFQFKRIADLSDKLSKALIDLCNVQQELEKVTQEQKSTWVIEDMFDNEVTW